MGQLFKQGGFGLLLFMLDVVVLHMYIWIRSAAQVAHGSSRGPAGVFYTLAALSMVCGVYLSLK